MFPWADVGSPRDAWEEVSYQELDREKVYHAIPQLRGLADALYILHKFNRGAEQDDITRKSPKMARFQERGSVVRLNDEHGKEREDQDFTTQGSIRHGDLKLENILKFRDSDDPLGILKIADVG
jgi:serine/threonine protein kinase